MMKKISIILVMLFWCNISFAECIEGDCNNGQGTATWAYGDKYDKYVGEFKDGEMHGQGTFIFADGNKLVGQWKDGGLHGQGTYTWPSGTKYVGEFKDGKQHGQGTSTWANGNKYVGEFKDGKQHGQGTTTYASGAKYVGEYKNGKQDGQGTQIDADGGKYVGGWKNNKHHGIGTATSPDGEIFVAKHKNGKVVEIISHDTSAKEKMELASMIDDAKKTCKDLGFTEGTDKFSDCSLKLYSQSVELAAKNNQQVVMQAQSSGSSSMTIYDPVRDSRALMKQGQRMLSGGCTLGINC